MKGKNTTPSDMDYRWPPLTSAEGTAEAEKVSFLLGVNSNDFIKCLIKPKIKVGTEVVTQGRNKAQVSGIIVI
jgi:myosin heavy subunit